jgi:hypothetical protein
MELVAKRLLTAKGSAKRGEVKEGKRTGGWVDR